MNNKPLMTMEEKKKLDPNEMMENGLTRAQNDKLQKDGESVSLVTGIISLVLVIYSLKLLFSI